ncbi:OmpA family protein [Billgrantia montanilacus]|nr:OmpA family protein [Halomonas montanilacus]
MAISSKLLALGVAVLAASLSTAHALAQEMRADSTDGSVMGEWVGTYTCAQGLTGLTLTIAEATPTSARAMFHFYADPRNPQVPTGCFTMEGNYDPVSSRLQLSGHDWLLRPSGYMFVSFEGMIDAEGRNFQGLVSGPPRCTTFKLSRQPSPATPQEKCVFDTPTIQGDQISAGKIAQVLADDGRIDLNILFDFSKATIRPDSRSQLDELGRILMSPLMAEQRIGIFGHTDAVGSVEANQQLSEERAAAVLDYLVDRFNAPDERFEIRGFGKDRLKKPDSPQDEANRRVEIMLLNNPSG